VLARWPNVNVTDGHYTWQLIDTGGNNSFSMKAPEVAVGLYPKLSPCSTAQPRYTSFAII
jgi:hypothetical protein